MNITKENNGLTSYLKLELVSADYQEKVEKELKDYRKKVQLKGFRPGQVPAGLIKQMYGKAILMDSVNALVGESIDNYIKENKLNILGHALLVDDEAHKPVADYDNPSDFIMWFEIAEVPAFDIDLSKLKIKAYEVKVPDENVDKQVETLKSRYGQVTNPETAGESDTLYGQLTELDENGNVKEGGISVTPSIVINKIALKTIQKQFIGKKVDAEIDFDVQKAFKNKADLTAMLNITESKLSEINSKFRYKITGIMHVDPAELGEDLYNKAYPDAEIKDEKAFRDKIREDIAGYYAQNTDKKFYVDTVDAVVDSTKFELPEDFVKRWIISSENAQRERDGGKEPVTDIPAEEMKQVLRSLRWEMIQNKISEKYGLKIEEQDLRDFYKNRVLSQYFPVNSKDEESQKRVDMFIDSMMKNQEEVKRVFDMVFEEKMTAVFKENVKADKKSVTMDEFIEELKKEKK